MRVSIQIVISILVVCSAILIAAAAQQPTLTTAVNGTPAAPAPTGFDNATNGLVSQAVYDADKEVFEEKESIEKGLGPVYNAPACADCHATPVVGGSSQVTVLRAGHWDRDRGQFIDHPGGSLIQDRAIDAKIQEQVIQGYEVRAHRSSPSILGLGFIEAIDDNTLIAIANRQPPNMRGEIIRVPVLEASGALRVARFGWKTQHASLESFSADAYLNEMGITSPLQPVENTSNGNSIVAFDHVADPEDDGKDVRAFAEFMRATKAPPRDELLAATADAQAGSDIFNRIACATCHVPTIVTARVGTTINGGAFVVPPALGNKVIHPFSDYMLHDVGTGDGIVQNGGVSTRNKMRTAPLWGLRTRSRLLHDGSAETYVEAILRHQGEAGPATVGFITLAPFERRQLLAFLDSL